MPRYRVGCTGWSYDDWRGVFYPEGTPAGEYLARYARVFDLVEVDSSFYRPPTPFLTRRWAAATPPGFLFAPKVPKAITHIRGGPPIAESVGAFVEALRPLRDAGKLGPIVAQFAASFRREKDSDRLDEILGAFPPDLPFAVELRHRSWWVPDTLRRLERRRAALVWTVYPGLEPPFWVPGEFLYARFVGDRALTTFDRIQRDGRPTMEAMRARLESEGAAARDAFLLVNNHFMGFGPGTAELLQRVLGVPPADLGAAARERGQRTL